MLLGRRSKIDDIRAELKRRKIARKNKRSNLRFFIWIVALISFCVAGLVWHPLR